MKTLKNSSGQLIVEAMLLIVALFAVTLLVSTQFRAKEFIAAMVSGPWVSMAGMIQNGSWGSPRDTYSYHPSQHHNHISLRGEEAEK